MKNNYFDKIDKRLKDLPEPENIEKPYDIKPLLNASGDISFVFGERSNGKSFQAKVFLMIGDFLFNGNEFIYLRRIKDEVSLHLIEKWFGDFDLPLKLLSKGKYDKIIPYNKSLYLCHYDDVKKRYVKDVCCGYYMCLNDEQKIAGGQYPKVHNIIFDEALSRSVYLAGELDKLNNLFCTIDRKRNFVKLYLLGNSISKNNPYFIGWDVLYLVRRMKQGQMVEVEKYTSDNIKRKIVLEYAEQTGASSFTIGSHSAMYNSGEWQTEIQPKLNDNWKDWVKIFCCGFDYKTFKFLGFLLYKDNTYKWFIFPKDNTDFKKDTIIFSDIIDDNNLNSPNPYNLKKNNKMLYNIMETFRECNICYCSDLCGTEFKDVINFAIKK